MTRKKKEPETYGDVEGTYADVEGTFSALPPIGDVAEERECEPLPPPVACYLAPMPGTHTSLMPGAHGYSLGRAIWQVVRQTVTVGPVKGTITHEVLADGLTIEQAYETLQEMRVCQ